MARPAILALVLAAASCSSSSSPPPAELPVGQWLGDGGVVIAIAETGDFELAVGSTGTGPKVAVLGTAKPLQVVVDRVWQDDGDGSGHALASTGAIGADWRPGAAIPATFTVRANRLDACFAGHCTKLTRGDDAGLAWGHWQIVGRDDDHLPHQARELTDVFVGNPAVNVEDNSLVMRPIDASSTDLWPNTIGRGQVDVLGHDRYRFTLHPRALVGTPPLFETTITEASTIVLAIHRLPGHRAEICFGAHCATFARVLGFGKS